jgi:8-oxo-dGTP pyrophosphatase MutT (NUDIX family)
MTEIFHVDRLELRLEQKPWAFAVERQIEIDAVFENLKREKPAIWNGRILLLHSRTVEDGVFRGAYLETDYASFTAWCAWGRPHAAVEDCFSAAALVAADGAILLGRMGAHTFNAGEIYFPCGTPDQDDLVEGRVDLDASVRRELMEETGLDIGAFSAEPGWTTVVDGVLIAQVKVLRARQDADTLRARILEYLARDPQPELSDIYIVRGPDDFDPAMPRFVTAFLERWFCMV